MQLWVYGWLILLIIGILDLKNNLFCQGPGIRKYWIFPSTDRKEIVTTPPYCRCNVIRQGDVMLYLLLLCVICGQQLLSDSATITEQWEDEYSKVGKVLHKYAQNTKFKALRGVMVVPDTKEVVWLTEKCSFLSTGADDCDFFLQNVQTLMSIEENPICRRAGGLSFSLDPWDTSEVWGKSFRKVYYPEACASILRTSIAGATMFDADWDLKHLVNNTMGIGDGIEGYRSLDEWESLANVYIDPLEKDDSSSGAATVYTMTRLWVAVTGIEEAITPDRSILYFGNVSIEVRASSLVKNISTPSGFSDSAAPPPVAYRRFVEHVNRHMPELMRRLKSFRQLAQLAVAQEAVKFVSARRGVFPDGYLQALDYTVDLPQQVPAVVSMREHTLHVQLLTQLVKPNTSIHTAHSELPGEGAVDTLQAVGVKDISELTGAQDYPLQEVGDYSTYQYSCGVLNGTLAQVELLQQLLAAERLALNCVQILDLSEEEEVKKEEPPPKEEAGGIFKERADLGDACLPGALAVWDASAESFVMVPSAYLFVPGVPRVYNTTAEVVVARWTCSWPENDADDEDPDEEEPVRTDRKSRSHDNSNKKGGECRQRSDGGASCAGEGYDRERDREDLPILHTHTHYAALAPGAAPNSRRLQLQYTVPLPPYTDAASVTSAMVSLTGKVVVVVMPRAWDALPPACSLPQLLHELQSEWVYSLDPRGEDETETVDLDGLPGGAPEPTGTGSEHDSRRLYRSSSEGTSAHDPHSEIGAADSITTPAGVVLVHSSDFISPVVEVDSAYLGEATLDLPLRVVSHNYGTDMLEQITTSPGGSVTASLACGISRTTEPVEEKTEDSAEVTEDAEYSMEFGKSTYRTLDSANLKSTTVGCQATFIVVPEGYEIAPALPDILTYVVGEHHWGTDKLVLADGYGYATKLTTNARPGKQLREIPLEWETINPTAYAPNDQDRNQSQSQSQFAVATSTGADVVAIRPGVCASRILIRTKPVMVPYGGFFYHTLDLADVAGTSAGCQDGPLVLPDFLDVAPAISDVINNIVTPFGWDTDVLVLRDRRGYFTARAGADLAGKMCCERKELLYVEDQPRGGWNSSFEDTDGPEWKDAASEQMLSVLRCNARILVRQPIVTYTYNESAASATLQFLEQRKTTQSVSMNITRVSYGPQQGHVHNKKGSGYAGKLLPGTIKSHIYSLTMRLCYTLFTHGGVDLMHIKVTRMGEVPAEVLQQLQERLGNGTSGSSGSGDGVKDRRTGGGSEQAEAQEVSTSRRSNPSGASANAPSGAPAAEEEPLRGLHAAHSSVLGEDFVADFQAQRNAWGKRLGAAMDHLDDHILGNIADAGAGKGDFIYRPASVVAQLAAARADEDSSAEAMEQQELPVPRSVQEVFRLVVEQVARVRVARRRIFQEQFGEQAGGAAAGDGVARAVTALLVESAISRSLFLLEYHPDGVVRARCVTSLQASAAAAPLVKVASKAVVAAKSATAVTEDQLVSWAVQEEEWRLQQRWTEVARAATVVELLRAMQMGADGRGLQYSEEENNSHMCQEDGRRFLGLSVEVAQFLQI